ncbi:hypothetical protein [Alkalihalobacillus trypoxylicola]|uniref:Uncharacterized protein n=1 Tax=Alkalihalobacillus trypoxylicola TaxID=519424 RepID=A0A161PZH7_9BACI|nr:hypothetical protein [Alkalihalobacillus trypoxylicola]KYG28135.1 hypothetical protein AZF04_09535 [Alkalihalobacillus trypoxylicola]
MTAVTQERLKKEYYVYYQVENKKGYREEYYMVFHARSKSQAHTEWYLYTEEHEIKHLVPHSARAVLMHDPNQI